MKIAFDTSVLVAGLHRGHPHHRRAVVWVDAVAQQQMTGLVTYHALVELWSVLTRLPASMGAEPNQALQLVDRVRRVFEVLALEPSVAPANTSASSRKTQPHYRRRIVGNGKESCPRGTLLCVGGPRARPTRAKPSRMVFAVNAT